MPRGATGCVAPKLAQEGKNVLLVRQVTDFFIARNSETKVSAKNFPRGGEAVRALGKFRPRTDTGYAASKSPCERVAGGGGDGAFVAAAPLCANPVHYHIVVLCFDTKLENCYCTCRNRYFRFSS